MKTALYDKHCRLGAHFVDFSGWEMPLQYSGISEEHRAVRCNAGLFDVSHMGRIGIEGPDAEVFLDYISTNKIAGKYDGSATYTPLCALNGTCVDDTIIYRIDQTHFFMVANASNRQKDVAHLLHYIKDFKVEITPYFETEGILALQGPASQDIIDSIFVENRQLNKPMRVIPLTFQGQQVYLSTTGYTGAGGFEVYAPNELISELWDHILEEGKPYGIHPVGLGARNTLRLEMGYALYGHELSDKIAPTESIARWSVKLDKADFLGKEALIALENYRRYAYGIVLEEPGVARDDYPIFWEGKKIGKVTSGSHSPTLGKSIALILSHQPLTIGNRVKVQIRGRFCSAQIISLPFVTH